MKIQKIFETFETFDLASDPASQLYFKLTEELDKVNPVF